MRQRKIEKHTHFLTHTHTHIYKNKHIRITTYTFKHTYTHTHTHIYTHLLTLSNLRIICKHYNNLSLSLSLSHLWLKDHRVDLIYKKKTRKKNTKKKTLLPPRIHPHGDYATETCNLLVTSRLPQLERGREGEGAFGVGR